MLKLSDPIAVAGHDIGGAVAQHLLAHDRLAMSRLALVNSVTYDSWPAPHVTRLLDAARTTTADEFLAARQQAVTTDLAGAVTEQRIADYVDPWTEPRVRRSWLEMAAAAESRYTLDLVPALRRSATPKLLIWGEDDTSKRWSTPRSSPWRSRKPRSSVSQKRNTFPTENAPGRIARALIDFFTAWRS